jgi:hypothetical protein
MRNRVSYLSDAFNPCFGYFRVILCRLMGLVTTDPLCKDASSSSKQWQVCRGQDLLPPRLLGLLTRHACSSSFNFQHYVEVIVLHTVPIS